MVNGAVEAMGLCLQMHFPLVLQKSGSRPPKAVLKTSVLQVLSYQIHFKFDLRHL